MRLSEKKIEAIKASFFEFFGSNDHIWLFGSRVDDQKRGGDIDLYIETNMLFEDAYDAKSKLVKALWRKIGEQKIDVVINSLPANKKTAIYDVAREEGIKLI